MLLAFSAIAGIGDKVVRFSTSGTDRYVDGSVVVDGECYALVWSPAGSTFGGFNADGTAASDNDFVVLAAPLAKGGKCRDTLFQIPAEEYAELEGGNFAVCLVDTRNANGAPAGVTEKSLPARVNRWGLIESGITVQSAGSISPLLASSAKTTLRSSASGCVYASRLSSVPASTKQPKITGMEFDGGRVRLTVEDTVPYLTYNVASGDSPDALVEDELGSTVDGADGSSVELKARASGSSRFYRVMRAE